MSEETMRYETPEEKQDRCDGYVEFGALHRSIMLSEAARKKVGAEASWEVVQKVADAFTPEECDAIYLAGLMADGRTEEVARKIMARECLFMPDEEPWTEWYAAKINAEQK